MNIGALIYKIMLQLTILKVLSLEIKYWGFESSPQYFVDKLRSCAMLKFKQTGSQVPCFERFFLFFGVLN